MAQSTTETPSEPYQYSTCADYLDTLDDITDAQIQRFHEQGYLAVRQAVDIDAIADAAQAMWDLIDGARPDFKGVMVEDNKLESYATLPQGERRDAVRKIHRFVEYDDRLKALSAHPGILSVLQRLLGEAPVLFQDMGLMKPPHGRQKPWHQDCAYFNVPIDSTIVGVWIALDEATPENGCLHIVPGSHKGGPQLHFQLLDWQICDTEVPVRRSAMVPLKPGGCLLWHGLLQHGSPTNLSNQRRRALQFHYEPQSIQKITDEERLAIYGGEGRGVEC